MSENEIQNAPSYFAIIPANVRYCKNLEMGARLLYGELTALSNQEGYAWANNHYFANLYDVDERTITRWLTSLKEEKLIEVQLHKDGIRTQRRIWIIGRIQNNLTTGQKCPDDRTIMSDRPDKNVGHNSTSNNTSNNTAHHQPYPSSSNVVSSKPAAAAAPISSSEKANEEAKARLIEDGFAPELIDRAIKRMKSYNKPISNVYSYLRKICPDMPATIVSIQDSNTEDPKVKNKERAQRWEAASKSFHIWAEAWPDHVVFMLGKGANYCVDYDMPVDEFLLKCNKGGKMIKDAIKSSQVKTSQAA